MMIMMNLDSDDLGYPASRTNPVRVTLGATRPQQYFRALRALGPQVPVLDTVAVECHDDHDELGLGCSRTAE